MPGSLSMFLLVHSSVLPLMIPREAVAQEAKEPERFFRRAEIDFWGTASKKRTQVASNKGLVESLFAEPVKMADGRTSIYIPPREVLAFLEDPTRENAKSYLDWQNARARKIGAALAALEAVKLEESPSLAVPKREPPIRNDTRIDKPHPGPIRLTYFRHSG